MKYIKKALSTFLFVVIVTITVAQENTAEYYKVKALGAWARQHYDSAISLINQALNYRSGYSGYYALRSNFYKDANKPELAINDLTTAINNFDTRLPAQYYYQKLEENYFSRGILYYSYTRDYNKALPDFNKAIELGYKFDAVFINRGTIYLSKGNYKEAITDFNKTISMGGASANLAYIKRSEAHEAMKNLDLALADCNTVLSQTRGAAFAYMSRAHIYDLMRNYDLAIADMTKAISLSKANPSDLTERAFYQAKKGANDLALLDFNSAISMDPQFPNPYRGRGSIYLSLGEYDNAIADFKKVISLKKNYPFAYLSMIFPLARLRRFDEAANYYDQYLQLNSNEHLEYIGWSYVQYYIKAACTWLPQNDYEQALREIGLAEKNYDDLQVNRNATEVSSYAAVVALKGYILEKLNRNAEARDAYKQALAINARQPEIIDALAAVEKKLTFIAQADKTPPTIELLNPQTTRGFDIESDEEITRIIGRAKDPSGISSLRVNNVIINKTEEDGLFITDLLLKPGTNNIIITATDKQGNTASKTFTINTTLVTKKKVVDPDIPVLTDIPPKYHAILIAEENYADSKIPNLSNPVKDAREIRNILRARYNFDVANIDTLYNRSREDIMQAIVYRCNTFTDNDNLLIFYAGHGIAIRDQFGDVDGYWIPVTAKKGEIATYISASDINISLKRSKAKHILLVADACFSGAFTRSLPGDAGIGIQKLYKMNSRKVMASGNLEPVPDNSKFIYYFKKTLVDNSEKYISAKDVFDSFYKAVLNNTETIPQYAAIKNVGDEGGEFIFIKK